MYQAFANEPSTSGISVTAKQDALVELFRHKYQVPVEKFLEHMREQQHSVAAQSAAKAPS